MEKLYTVAYDHYIYAQHNSGGLGDMSEGICIFSHSNQHKHPLIAIDEEGIKKYLETHGIPNWVHGNTYSLEDILDTELESLEIEVGVYTFSEQRLDVCGTLDDINTYIETIRPEYADYVTLRAVPLTYINNQEQ